MNKSIFPGVLNLFNDITDGADIAVQHGNKLAFRVDCQLQAGIILTAAITGFWRSRCKRGINYPYYLSKAVGDAESGRRIAPLL